MLSVFLSHSSSDKELVTRIAEDLKDAGIPVWLDAWEILPGDSVAQKIQEGLDALTTLQFTQTSQSLGILPKPAMQRRRKRRPCLKREQRDLRRFRIPLFRRSARLCLLRRRHRRRPSTWPLP